MSIYKRLTFTGMLRLLAQFHDSKLAQAPFFIGSSQCVCIFSVLAIISSRSCAGKSLTPKVAFFSEGWTWTGAVRLCLHRFLTSCKYCSRIRTGSTIIGVVRGR